jgi:hypothetical protein
MFVGIPRHLIFSVEIIVDLLQMKDGVTADTVPVRLLAKAIEVVVSVIDRVTVAVRLGNQILIQIVGISFQEVGGEGCFSHVAVSIVLECGQVPGRVPEAGQVVLGVVGELSHAVIGVGDGDEAVRVVVRILRDPPILVSDTGTSPAIILAKLGGACRRRGIGDLREPVHHVVCKRGLLVVGVDGRGAIAVCVVLKLRDLVMVSPRRFRCGCGIAQNACLLSS